MAIRRSTGTPIRLALAGVAYAALLVVGAAAFPSPPGGDAPAGTDPAWLAHHTGQVIAQGYVRSIAVLAFLLLTAAVVKAVLREPTAISSAVGSAIGGSLYCALMLASQAVAVASALEARRSGGVAGLQALASLQSALLDLSSLPAMLLFGATAIAGLQGQLPRWLALFSLVGVPLAIIDALSFPGGPFEMVGVLGLVYFLAWSLLVGVRLALGSTEPTPRSHGAVETAVAGATEGHDR